MSNQIVADRIRQQRKKKGMTQKELAILIKRTESSVAKYEKGLVEIPISVIVKIAEVFKVSPNYISGYSDYETDDERIDSYKRESEIIQKLNRLDAYNRKDLVFSINLSLDLINNNTWLKEEGRHHLLGIFSKVISRLAGLINITGSIVESSNESSDDEEQTLDIEYKYSHMIDAQIALYGLINSYNKLLNEYISTDKGDDDAT